MEIIKLFQSTSVQQEEESGSKDKLGNFEQVQQDYINKVQEKLENVDELSFLDALELEFERLLLKITPNLRDSALMNMKLEIETFNPDRFIYPRDEKTEDILFVSKFLFS